MTGNARRGWLYIALAMGWTWGFWIAAAASGAPFGSPLQMALLIAGAAGVPGMAVLMLFAAGDAGERRDYWRRLIEAGRIGKAGWATILLLPPALALLGAAGFALQTGAWPEFAPLKGFLAAPLTLLPFLLFILLFGPLPEEPGWRGYALPKLQAAHGALAAALLLGAVHAAWHLPLFWMEGSHQASLGLLTPAFWRYMTSVVFLSVIMSALFNASAASTLSAVLIHFTNNLTGELLRLPDEAEWLRMGAMGLVALAIIVATRGRLCLQRD